MMILFDEEQIMKTYVKDMQKEAAKEVATETARRLIEKGMSLDDIADCSPQLSMDELREIEAEFTALV